jgi:transposase-like protein
VFTSPNSSDEIIEKNLQFNVDEQKNKGEATNHIIGQRTGVKFILEKYDLYPATYYSWKNKLEAMGEEGLQHDMTPQHQKRIRELEKENKALKQLAVSLPQPSV